ncbi:MAG: type I methionyl aminopeptidase [bacterium]|nr:type I methionyl aminopeptidase [bacterium]
MSIGDETDVRGLKTIGRIVARCLREMGQALEPGIRTSELDEIGATFLARHDAESAPQFTYGFPGATCISVNEVVAHGIPGELVIRAGDLVHIDVSARSRAGYFSDTGASFPVSPFSKRDQRLCVTAKMALREGIKAARPGARIGRIGRAFEKTARRAGFATIRNLCSHGVGRSLHEEPTEILGYDEPSDRRRLEEGQVLAIEPFVTDGTPWVEEGDDGWSLLTDPGRRAAQFEHTVILTRDKPLVVTLPG